MDSHWLNRFPPDEITHALDPFLTDERKRKIEKILDKRTREVVTVLDHIYDQGNINAVFRTAESLGFFETHIIESETTKIANRVAQGADKWLDIYRWKSASPCLDVLKKQGYLIAATDLNSELDISEIPDHAKLAVVFGNEKEGCSKEVFERADIRFKFPMNGFSQSFNISVAAAVCLTYFCYQKRSNPGEFDPDLKNHLRAKYYFKSYEHSDRILKALRDS